MDQLNLIKLLHREDCETTLINALSNFEENKNNLLTKRGIYIYGAPGSGKSRFVYDTLKMWLCVDCYDFPVLDYQDLRIVTYYL